MDIKVIRGIKETVNSRTLHCVGRAWIFLILASGLSLSCAARPSGVRISPERTWPVRLWSQEERGQEVAVRNLWMTGESSAHIIRLRTAEKPHVHDRHDLTVFVLAGSARIFLDGKFILSRAGDVIEIPRGTLHWAENLDKNASEVYALFTPAYDGRDSRVVLDAIPQASNS